MAQSNRERVGRALELLAEGLGPYVDRRMMARVPGGHQSTRDPHELLKTMNQNWELVFSKEHERSVRTLVNDCLEWRNRWAHNEAIPFDDAYRALDSVERLLRAIDAANADEVAKGRNELLRLRFETEAKKATPKAEALLTQPAAGLKPWREVVIPHDDVASGRFDVAEFAADLHQVHEGRGAAEYVDPVEFFRRTYLTEGLRRLLGQAVQRVTDHGGAPVVDLQTNFGGGKTHSLIALYHLLSGAPLDRLPQELQELVREAGVTALPSVRRAVLVGTRIAPGQPDQKPDGSEIRTLWGHLAWQLGGADAYALVAEADRTGTNPGGHLHDLLELMSPCLILIDEWVAYARQLYADDTLPGGTFDTHFTFAQALTEAARATKGALLVLSIPASEAPDGGESGGSDIEVGGVGGREALRRLRNVVGRIESAWRPASAEESFEIVRRRLFEPIGPDLVADRDATARVFSDFYRKEASEFPAECRDAAYLDRIKRAYPIHPELFARLYEDWSTLDRFQRTRGVLRLMAAVIHALWAAGDQSPLIMPASVTLADGSVQSEITRNLEPSWVPIIDADIDGPGSLPNKIDNDVKTLGQIQASRRVARTIFLASAPRANSPNRGVEAARVRLGCAIPGDSLALFGDALRRLSDRSSYLYVDQARYWYSTQRSVARLAQERAERLLTSDLDAVHAEIVRRLRTELKERGDFAGVHVPVSGPADLPDERDVRLAVLAPSLPHIARSDDSPALAVARAVLEKKTTGDRQYRNMVVFLAGDQRRTEELAQAAAEHLAWVSVDKERVELNLDGHQQALATSKLTDTTAAVDLRLAETYHWLLVPDQPDAQGPVRWESVRADGQGSLYARASRKLVHEGRLVTAFPPVLLRQRLDQILAPLWADGHVSVAMLWDAFARYLYLPRLRDIDVLIETTKQGPATTTWDREGFATADAVSGDGYGGVVTGAHPAIVTAATLLVRPDAVPDAAPAPRPIDQPQPDADGRPRPDPVPTMRAFHATARLDPVRLNRDWEQVAREVIAHLGDLVGTKLEITVEIRADNESGFPDLVIRTVSENARTLRFLDHGFESE